VPVTDPPPFTLVDESLKVATGASSLMLVVLLPVPVVAEIVTARSDALGREPRLMNPEFFPAGMKMLELSTSGLLALRTT
jgi:hypothetical protein